MKKTFKFGLFVAIFGFILLVLGLANHGLKGIIWHDNHFVTVEETAATYQPQHVTKLVLKTSDPVTIKTGNRFRVKTTSVVGEKVQVIKEGHQLTIKDGQNQGNQESALDGSPVNLDRVEITVPTTQKLTAVEGDSQLSDVTMTGISAANIRLQNRGNTTLTNVQAKTIQVRNGRDLYLTNVTAPAMTLSSVYGNVHLNRNQTTALTAEAKRGDVNVITNQRTGIQAVGKEVTVFGHHTNRVNNSADQQYRLTAKRGHVLVVTHAQQ
ncbi:DUF4097 family beta strand repeat-containing protein [Levilactobacillus bambusae]|uniref:DUF4097 domain-containing protein n=1 Tax=Levilactobacillus bambusae TaxID=2024736 RepID=A0A2V1N009_9LACO|nr:DUF4097 family beta strand repeat-containing protein [Levilactobacillus bambusae]PWG00554.1 hypothetical protein DCM90_06430 [Levilactobacillus bambusae]